VPGEKLLLHDSGRGLIHGRHRQGGSSAARFQRRRKDQTHHFLERVSEHLQEQLEPYVRTLDYFIFGGARVTILRLQKQCPFLAQFENRLLPPLLEVLTHILPCWRNRSRNLVQQGYGVERRFIRMTPLRQYKSPDNLTDGFEFIAFGHFQ